MGEKDVGYLHMQDLYYREKDNTNYSIKVFHEIWSDLEEGDVEEAKWLVAKALERLDG